MEKIKLEKIAKWCGGKTGNAALLNKVCSGISTDTRKIRKGDLFVPIKGENQNGHDFINEAIKKGAVASLSDRGEASDAKKLIMVQNTLEALGKIAAGYKNLFNCYTIGVTGSDGKTTTKELIKKTLSGKYNVKGSEGNYNNQIGLPLSIFNIEKTTEICVLEMGMNRKGEIDYLSKIAAPDCGVITNIGTAHIGYFNSMRKIAEAKSEIMDNLAGEKLSVLNYDSRFFGYLEGKAVKKISFGRKKGSDIRGVICNEKEGSFLFKVEGTKECFEINFWNTTAVYPALIAYFFAKKFSIPTEDFKKALSAMEPVQGRGRIQRRGAGVIIDESYNCNPNSLKWALYNFSRKNYRKKVAVIGDMAELGKLSGVLHRNIGIFASNLGIDSFLTVGEKSRIMTGFFGKRGKHFDDTEKLNKHLELTLKGDEAILVKGSRKMELEKTVEYLAGKGKQK